MYRFCLIDSHAHLDMEEFDPDRKDVLQRARNAGIGTILCPIDISSERSLEITLDLKAEGIPIRPRPDCIRTKPSSSRRAIGRYTRSWRPNKGSGRSARSASIFIMIFPRPTSSGTRSAPSSPWPGGGSAGDHPQPERGGGDHPGRAGGRYTRGGVLHCFTEDWECAEAMLDAGFFISFSGIVTFPKAEDLRRIAARIPADRLLVETDAPYLAPVPYRGKRNEPAYVVATAALLAGLLGMPLDRFAETASRNFRALFGS